MAADQVFADDFRNIREALVVQQSIYVLSAIIQVLCSDFLSHLILSLHFQELQPHAFDIGLWVGLLNGQVTTKLIPEQTEPKEEVSSTNEDLMERRNAVLWSRFEVGKTELC